MRAVAGDWPHPFKTASVQDHIRSGIVELGPLRTGRLPRLSLARPFRTGTLFRVALAIPAVALGAGEASVRRLVAFLKWTAGLTVLVGAAVNARAADETPSVAALIARQNQQLDLQARQIESLQRRLDSLQLDENRPAPVIASFSPVTPAAWRQPNEEAPPPTGAVPEYEPDGTGTAPRISAPAEFEALPEGGESTGDLLRMSTRWDPSNGVRFETQDKSFSSHIGFRFQEDSVWFNQSPQLKPNSQLGELQDGTFFRRIRPSWDGVAYGVIEWNCELALEAVKEGIPTLDEVWVGIKDIPYVGSVRIGHIKVPQGFEGDMVSSSKAMTFMERASYTDAFYQNFGPGIWTGNSVLDQRFTWAAAFYRNELSLHDNTGADFGDGNYGVTGRITGLPLFQDDGWYLLHLGASGTWRKAPEADPGTGGPSELRFAARPQMRDASGDFGNTILTGDSVKIVNTGFINCNSATVWGLELFSVIGPFSVQAEYAFAFMNDAIVGGRSVGDLPYSGGYLELSYFLTGENRSYDRRLGREGTTYILRPNEVFASGRNKPGQPFGWGAFEIAACVSHLNLDNSVVTGGQTDALEVVCNWYLNTNLKFQLEYLVQDRYRMGDAQLPGNIQGIGFRTQYFF